MLFEYQLFFSDIMNACRLVQTNKILKIMESSSQKSDGFRKVMFLY